MERDNDVRLTSFHILAHKRSLLICGSQIAPLRILPRCRPNAESMFGVIVQWQRDWGAFLLIWRADGKRASMRQDFWDDSHVIPPKVTSDPPLEATVVFPDLLRLTVFIRTLPQTFLSRVKMMMTNWNIWTSQGKLFQMLFWKKVHVPFKKKN